ncbi:mitochondrial import inner membrane translocase subunit TIM44-like isoform X2 [Carassius carassius]|uniref:mitochondrial import inner membrane translocase subunit TIM44-like isoform X2 n=1 Tax=Carassius carassius TaxID=217509 RepID=UPI0028686B0D|nr:mitochondrial import inner membrane translocase subunit TIM44-like isoform X2 [Carassius carassius]
MAASLCQCYQVCVRRSSALLVARQYASLYDRAHVYRIAMAQARFMSSSGGRKGFLGEFMDNLKQELSKNKEMKENIKKFREEARKLEESEALKQARRKYKTIESETVKTSEVLKKTLGTISETVKEGLGEVGRSDIGKKIKEGMEEATKTAKHSAETVSKGGEKLGKTGAFRALSQGVESVKKEIGDLGQIGPYRTPSRLRKRSDFSSKTGSTEVFKANEEAMGVVLHKDSKWYQQWKDFKDNNAVFNRIFEMKMKYDESDNAFIRASRAVTDKMTDIIGGLFSKTEMSEVLTEILKVDPNFDKDSFLKQCERDIIPNILEAMIQGELDVLKDWCYEATYSQLAHPIQQAKAMGLQFHSKILDIDNIDLAMGKMMEQGPVLIITFQAQLVMVICNVKGEVMEGDPEKVLRMMYVWALCRDQDELNPYAAWRLLDISASSTEQIL